MIESFDRALFLGINSFHYQWLNPVMKVFSGQLIWLPFLIFLFFKSRSILQGKSIYLFWLFIGLVIISSDVTSSYFLKNLFERLRPCRIPELKIMIHQFGQKCGGKYGFVSSHAANTMGLMTFSLLSLSFDFKKFWWFWTLPVFVGWSRIYLGVHYPGDILGGFLVGSFWGMAFYWIFKNRVKGQDAASPSLRLL